MKLLPFAATLIFVHIFRRSTFIFFFWKFEKLVKFFNNHHGWNFSFSSIIAEYVFFFLNQLNIFLSSCLESRQKKGGHWTTLNASRDNNSYTTYQSSKLENVERPVHNVGLLILLLFSFEPIIRSTLIFHNSFITIPNYHLRIAKNSQQFGNFQQTKMYLVLWTTERPCLFENSGLCEPVSSLPKRWATQRTQTPLRGRQGTNPEPTNIGGFISLLFFFFAFLFFQRFHL